MSNYQMPWGIPRQFSQEECNVELVQEMANHKSAITPHTSVHPSLEYTSILDSVPWQNKETLTNTITGPEDAAEAYVDKCVADYATLNVQINSNHFRRTDNINNSGPIGTANQSDPGPTGTFYTNAEQMGYGSNVSEANSALGNSTVPPTYNIALSQQDSRFPSAASTIRADPALSYIHGFPPSTWRSLLPEGYRPAPPSTHQSDIGPTNWYPMQLASNMPGLPSYQNDMGPASWYPIPLTNNMPGPPSTFCSNFPSSSCSLAPPSSYGAVPPSTYRSDLQTPAAPKPADEGGSRTAAAVPSEKALKVRSHVKKPQPMTNYSYPAGHRTAQGLVKVDDGCQVEGCQAKAYFRRMPVRRDIREEHTMAMRATFPEMKVVSKFCEEHTCKVSGAGARGWFCPCPKYRHERLCTCCSNTGRQE